MSGLAALEASVARELSLLSDQQPWVAPRSHASGGHVFDVVIVGGGQSGLGAAFALKREGVTNTLVLDECPEGAEGPWITYARMITLRTSKAITGVESNLPSLTYRAWHEAQWGAEDWEKLDKIPRGKWMDYLRWFRRITGANMRNGARVTRIAPADAGLFRVEISGAEPVLARKVVLATGIQGGGEWHTPDFIKTALPRARYGHTSEDIDYTRFAGKHIGILGAGASAFDNAQHALGLGVAEAHVFVRRKQLPRINPIRHMERTGLSKRYALLSDADKYAALSHYLGLAMPPTNDTYSRARAHQGFQLHLGEAWEKVREENGRAIVTSSKGEYAFDFLVLSTGIRNDVALRPELADFAGDIALWRDKHQPTGKANPDIDQHPYLGPGFELTGRDAAGDARLHGLFVFNYSALASLGLSASALSGLRHALPRLVEGVSRQLFLDDRDATLASFYAYAEEEFLG